MTDQTTRGRVSGRSDPQAQEILELRKQLQRYADSVRTLTAEVQDLELENAELRAELRSRG